MSIILSIWTVVVAVMFIGIVLWVWNGRNKAKYEQAARIPFNEGDEDGGNGSKEDPKHG